MHVFIHRLYFKYLIFRNLHFPPNIERKGAQPVKMYVAENFWFKPITLFLKQGMTPQSACT